MSAFTSQVPPGKSVSVKIIDSTSKIVNLPAKALMGPAIPGFDDMPEIPTWSFFIEHESGRKLLFDLGIPIDWQEMAPTVANRLKTNGWGISVVKPTVQILKEHDIDPSSIEGIVWSHWHWDHTIKDLPSAALTPTSIRIGRTGPIMCDYCTNPGSFMSGGQCLALRHAMRCMSDSSAPHAHPLQQRHHQRCSVPRLSLRAPALSLSTQHKLEVLRMLVEEPLLHRLR